MFTKPIFALLGASIALTAAATSPVSASSQEVRDHRTKVEVRDHRTPQRKTEVVIVKQGDVDCRVGVAQLFKMGYTAINPYDCDGAVYHYTAMDGHSLFHAAMSSHSGSIRVEFVGIAN
jgi:hypothetical protein